VRPGKPELLGRAMRAMADEPAAREAMGRRARRLMQRLYTWSGIEQRLERWYRGDVLGKRGDSWAKTQARTS
jgi:glycosyltransferase involved in cell wall biosynthesis